MDIDIDVVLGAPIKRQDAQQKVTGQARYGADMSLPNVAYAYLVTSRIARGRIVSFNDATTRGTRGILDVVTYRDINGAVKPGKLFSSGGYVSSSMAPLGSDQVFYSGQIVAVVLAETFEAAREG